LLLRAAALVVLKVIEQVAVAVLVVIEHLMGHLVVAEVPNLYLHLRLQPTTQLLWVLVEREHTTH
jgi:hypothetical protein